VAPHRGAANRLGSSQAMASQGRGQPICTPDGNALWVPLLVLPCPRDVAAIPLHVIVSGHNRWQRSCLPPAAPADPTTSVLFSCPRLPAAPKSCPPYPALYAPTTPVSAHLPATLHPSLHASPPPIHPPPQVPNFVAKRWKQCCEQSGEQGQAQGRKLATLRLVPTTDEAGANKTEYQLQLDSKWAGQMALWMAGCLSGG